MGCEIKEKLNTSPFYQRMSGQAAPESLSSGTRALNFGCTFIACCVTLKALEMGAQAIENRLGANKKTTRISSTISDATVGVALLTASIAANFLSPEKGSAYLISFVSHRALKLGMQATGRCLGATEKNIQIISTISDAALNTAFYTAFAAASILTPTFAITCIIINLATSSISFYMIVEDIKLKDLIDNHLEGEYREFGLYLLCVSQGNLLEAMDYLAGGKIELNQL